MGHYWDHRGAADVLKECTYTQWLEKWNQIEGSFTKVGFISQILDTDFSIGSWISFYCHVDIIFYSIIEIFLPMNALGTRMGVL